MFSARRSNQNGFTLVEMLILTVVIMILAAVLLPRYWDVASKARARVVEGVAGSMRTAIGIAESVAHINSLRADQNAPIHSSRYVVDINGADVALNGRNLCPLSQVTTTETEPAPLSMLDYMTITDRQLFIERSSENQMLLTEFDEQYTWIGFDIREQGKGGCYVVYDSMNTPQCSLAVVLDDC